MNKNKSQTAQAEPKSAVIDVSIRVYLNRKNGPTLANATVDLGGEYAVKGLRVVQGKDGPFVAMPQRRTSKGEYQDVAFPVTKAARERLYNAVLDAYDLALKQTEKQEQTADVAQNGSAMTMQ